MEYFKTSARCPECGLSFEYAVTQDEIEDGSAMEIFCPRCGESTNFEDYTPCSERDYERILEEYEELEDVFELEEFEEDFEEEEWF